MAQPVKFNKFKIHSTITHNGGDSKEWKNILSNIGLNVECQSQNIGKDIVNRLYALNEEFKQHPFYINPNNYETFPELCNAVWNYLAEWEYRTEETLNQRMRYARLMSDPNQPFPIDFFALDYNQYILQMKWYEKNYYDKKTGKNYYGLKHRKDTFNDFSLAYGINPKIWHLKLPPIPIKKHRHIPPPYIVHKMINYNFYPDNKDKTQLMQNIHAHAFWIGPRPPSELSLLTLDSFNFDEGFINIIEQKRHYSVRTIYPEEVIMTGKTRKSFKNFIDYVRPRFVSQYSGNALYIGVRDGKPITKEYMSNLLHISGRLAYQLYTPYSARHWCATARLIKCWKEGDPDPLDFVMNFMGHEDLSTTKTYTEQARVLYKKYPFDWIKRTLKWPNVRSEDSTLKSKQGQKTPVSNGNISVRKVWARRDSNS